MNEGKITTRQSTEHPPRFILVRINFWCRGTYPTYLRRLQWGLQATGMFGGQRLNPRQGQ